MWNEIILTAGSETQNIVFKRQLNEIPIKEFAEKAEIITDESKKIRIGSGGATIGVIRKSLENEDLENKKTLLVHSGGLSQRMPHLSAYGKVFSLLTNHKTILETKLNIYKNELIEKLQKSGGIMITASDVIENMEGKWNANSDSDLVVFAHISSVEIGTQHGVFMMDKKKKLKRVLQKPTIDEMNKEGAIREDGNVLTDSCYFMTWKFCKRLIDHPLFREPITEELCCYGDFMRPMGYDPELNYIENSSSKLGEYRKALAEIFKTAKVEICVLGEKSFFHFGTYHEYIENFLPNSNYREVFPRAFESNSVFCKRIENVPDSSFVEFSSGPFQVGEHSVISGIETGNKELKLPNHTVIFTMALKEKKYASVVINIDEDIKKKNDDVEWNGHKTKIREKSIWDSQIFKICDSRMDSLMETIQEWENGIEENQGKVRVSIAEIVKMHDFEADLEWRNQFNSL